jgi:hypothetical protein
MMNPSIFTKRTLLSGTDWRNNTDEGLSMIQVPFACPHTQRHKSAQDAFGLLSVSLMGDSSP